MDPSPSARPASLTLVFLIAYGTAMGFATVMIISGLLDSYLSDLMGVVPKIGLGCWIILHFSTHRDIAADIIMNQFWAWLFLLLFGGQLGGTAMVSNAAGMTAMRLMMTSSHVLILALTTQLLHCHGMWFLTVLGVGILHWHTPMFASQLLFCLLNMGMAVANPGLSTREMLVKRIIMTIQLFALFNLLASPKK